MTPSRLVELLTRRIATHRRLIGVETAMEGLDRRYVNCLASTVISEALAEEAYGGLS